MAAADAVFRGVVVAVERAEPEWRSSTRAGWCTVKHWFGGPDSDTCIVQSYIARHWENYGFIATFRVTSVWKGPEVRELRVRSNVPGGGSCGLGWAVGGEWVVYAYGAPLLSTDGCSRSKFGERVSEESRLLGEPRTTLR
jgi:hypothetical protein